MKKGFLAILSVMTAIAVAGCGQSGQEQTNTQPTAAGGMEKLKVSTSIYPLQYVTTRIGGDHTEVINIVPTGVEPHDFEPTAKDMVALSNTNLFVYNGSGFELWVDKAVEGLDKTKTTVVNTTEGLELLHAKEVHEEEHEHGEFDPHVWLDPTLLKAQAEKVKNALVQTDQAHSVDYEKNFEQLSADLDLLDKDLQAMTAKATTKEFMVSHSAFGYLAHKYGLEQIAISGVSPADEPSPSEMKELVEHVKEHKIKYILFETLVSPKVAEVIARETGAKTATLNPLEGLTEEEAKAGKDYISVMRGNLETLNTALQ